MPRWITTTDGDRLGPWDVEFPDGLEYVPGRQGMRAGTELEHSPCTVLLCDGALMDAARVRRPAMTQPQIKDPFQLLGELILKENARTLVIHGKDRTIARVPLGFAMVAGMGLFFVTPPALAIVLLTALYMDGGSITIESPGRVAPVAAVLPTRIGRNRGM
jgi:hypothetical protein